ncbi:oligopeptide/dipeptide ABC transporter ATP-binding protein [Aquipuribacter sp. MA13-6]|uniref:oligopeptide/dipeptide ABC transporter ATP-binding protein n=1 Tax=unclassified Aquipuribacter TaxID=2635084 RepID=UPI003EE86424
MNAPPTDPTTTGPTTVRGLTVTFPGLPTVHGVDLDLAPGRLTAVVGESGAGKSVVVAALLGLLPRSATVHGTLGLPGDDRTGPLEVDLADRSTLARHVRGRRVSLVPQSPTTWITPVRTLGSQLDEAARAVRGPRVGRPVVAEAVGRAVARAHLPADLLDRYPHEVSGGQLQRAALALALVGGARVLLADEPTTGLDPELAEVALTQLRAEADTGAAVLVVTHDLEAAERVADEVVVLYAGRVVERARADELFAAPAHPYAAGLLDSLPGRAFVPVAGDPPGPGEHVTGCVFRPRCPRAVDRCDGAPGLVPAAGAERGRLVACHRPLVGAGS